MQFFAVLVWVGSVCGVVVSSILTITKKWKLSHFSLYKTSRLSLQNNRRCCLFMQWCDERRGPLHHPSARSSGGGISGRFGCVSNRL